MEDLGGKWDAVHAAAYARCSVGYLRRSDCPKHPEKGMGIQGKTHPYYVPAEVRAWDHSRNVKEDAA